MSDSRTSTERARDDADEARAIAAVREIERLLRDMAPGWRNTDAVKAIEAQSGVVEAAVGGRPGWAYVREKLTSLRGNVDVLSSAREWSFAFADCANARSGIERIFNVARGKL